MKESSIEQFKEEEKTTVEKLQELKAEKKEEEGPWRNIEPKFLIQEALDIFDSVDGQRSKEELLAASEGLRVLREKIEKMPEGDKRASNENFSNLIDDLIEDKINRTIEE